MYVRKVSVRSGTEIQVQGEKGMIKRSDVKQRLFLYCSRGWWWVSNTIRLLWIHLEESHNSSEYARHTYVYAQIWIYTQSAFHMLRFESVDSTDCKLKKQYTEKKFSRKFQKAEVKFAAHWQTFFIYYLHWI